jgi:hypothetical protein
MSVYGTLVFPRGRTALAPAITADVARQQEQIVPAVVATDADLHRDYPPGTWVAHVVVATRAAGTKLPTVVKAISDGLR